MSKNPRNDRYAAEFSSRQRRLVSGRKLPSAINLPSSSGRARVSPKNKFASSDDNTAFAAAIDGDPEYLFFLHHLRLEGSGYVFEMPTAGGFANPMRWKYEEDEVTRYRTRPQPQPQKQRKRVSETNMERDRKPEKKQRTISASAKSGFTSTSPSSGEVRLMYDEDYRMFLDRVTMRDDESMVVQWDNNVTIVYEEESVHDDEVVVIEDEKPAKVNNAYINLDSDSCDGYPLRPSPKHNDIKNLLQILRGKSPSTFTNRLMSVLEKPFDQKEYDDLMILATRRKPITRFKHLREDSVPYETDLIGCSYLDHYPDLAKQIQSTEKETALFLLRGFFFWLKNIGHVGAYMPWSATSSSCMSTMFLDSKNAYNISDKFSRNEL